jgi:Na+:H+ antiporter, NhaA family
MEMSELGVKRPPKESSPPPLEYVSPLATFFKQDAVAAGLLLTSALLALILANSAWGDEYHHILETYVSIGFGEHAAKMTLHHVINDGLMAIFFFLVGLEIKREILVGELASFRKALLPAVAALGGMIAPALLYTAFNYGQVTAIGWGIPMATDIAFAMGVMAMLGRRIPPSLGVFLVAVAIVDDLGAVTVIALFYSEGLQVIPFWEGNALIAFSYVLNRLGVRNAIPYFILFIFIWMLFLQSGVHATIAGVLLAFTIPANARYKTPHFFGRMSVLLYRFSDAEDYDDTLMVNARQQQLVRSILKECHHVEAPLQRIEHSLHPFSVFVIMPIFAFANAGTQIEWGQIGHLLAERPALGVMFGLLAGKLGGVFLATYVSVKLKLTEMPTDANWGHIAGVGLLSGIGFTMSLFINELAFKGLPDSGTYVTEAKLGVFLASIVAGVAGSIVLRMAGKGKTYEAGGRAH